MSYDREEGTPEFSFVVHPSEQDERTRNYDLEANAEEREALAVRFGLIAIERFTARLSLARRRGAESWHLSGWVDARVIQQCVVTLEPVENEVRSEIEIIFIDKKQYIEEETLYDDLSEPFEGDTLDLGEIAAEELSLALEPYPRADGVELSDMSDTDRESLDRPNPFSVLATLKENK